MSQSKNQNLQAVLESLVKFLAQTAGKDKIAKILQYGGKLIAALAATELAAKAKRVESAAGAARKVFRLGNELSEIQKVKAQLRPGVNLTNPNTLLQLARAIGMYWYWTFDHLVWAANTGLTKLDGPKYAYYGSLAWCVGLISTILIDLRALSETVRRQRALQLEQWSGSGGKPETSKNLQETIAKKNAIVLNCVKNVADLGVASTLVRVTNFSPAKIGVLGLISAFIGAYQLY